jgi:hypothetical protein
MPQICISNGNKIMCFDFFARDKLLSKKLSYKRSTKTSLGRWRTR